MDLRERLRQPVAVAVAEEEAVTEGEAVADNNLDNAFISLIISLLAQDTSQMLLYE